MENSHTNPRGPVSHSLNSPPRYCIQHLGLVVSSSQSHFPLQHRLIEQDPVKQAVSDQPEQELRVNIRDYEVLKCTTYLHHWGAKL